MKKTLLLIALLLTAAGMGNPLPVSTAVSGDITLDPRARTFDVSADITLDTRKPVATLILVK